MPSLSQSQWSRYAERRLKRALLCAHTLPGLARLGPKTKAWSASLHFMGSTAMRALNFKYRKKNYPTDILSFPAEKTFRRTGTLGELVICQPVLRRQAKEHAHSEKVELDVLLVHGLLHLLGLDHEKGGREATQMGRLEKQLLERLGRVESSLIERS